MDYLARVTKFAETLNNEEQVNEFFEILKQQNKASYEVIQKIIKHITRWTSPKNVNLGTMPSYQALIYAQPVTKGYWCRGRALILPMTKYTTLANAPTVITR